MIYIPVSYGELIDKITILEIKKSKITDHTKLQFINKELNILFNLYKTHVQNNDFITTVYDKLKQVNQELWNTEDDIRLKEKNNQFDSDFIELSRKVYIFNDLRGNLKRLINEHCDSEIQEIKSYQEY